MIQAQVVQHSVADGCKPLITIVAEYPRCIHSEVMTHRVFSRNAMSSRAVPVAKMIKQVRDNPFVPRHWGANQPGMQAYEEVSPDKKKAAEHEWRRAAEHAAYFAESLNTLGLHKQIVNRLLEPFQWMKTIITATEWDNFFDLRDHPAAEPHFQMLARAMKKAITESEPTPRGKDPANVRDWHLPFVHETERAVIAANGYEGSLFLARLSSARCARVSYLNHDGTKPDAVKDIELFERLAGANPRHASPLEHAAFAGDGNVPFANFRGWASFRWLLESQPAKQTEEALGSA